MGLKYFGIMSFWKICGLCTLKDLPLSCQLTTSWNPIVSASMMRPCNFSGNEVLEFGSPPMKSCDCCSECCTCCCGAWCDGTAATGAACWVGKNKSSKGRNMSWWWALIFQNCCWEVFAVLPKILWDFGVWTCANSTTGEVHFGWWLKDSRRHAT